MDKALLALLLMLAPQQSLYEQALQANGISPTVQTTEQVCSIANACLVNVELGKGAECHGPDLKHLTCSGLVITYKPQNVEIHVISQ